MKNIFKILVAFVLLFSAIPTQASVGIAGTFKYPDGTLFNGSLQIQMAKSGVRDTCSSNKLVPTTPTTIPIVNGVVQGSSASFATSDCLNPFSAYYIQVFDSKRQLVLRDNWLIGSTNSGGTLMEVSYLTPASLLVAQSPVTVTIPKAIVSGPSLTQTITQPVSTQFQIGGGPLTLLKIASAPSLCGSNNACIYTNGTDILASVNGGAYAILAGGGNAGISSPSTGGYMSRWDGVGQSAVLTNSLVRDDGTTVTSPNLTVTGQILASNGSVGTPSISFTSYPTTGLLQGTGGANTIGVSIAGTEIARFNSSGFTTVGTSPTISLGSDVTLSRAAADTLAIKRGNNSEGLWIYGTGSNYLSLLHNGTDAHIGTVGGGATYLDSAGTAYVGLLSSGNFAPVTDNAMDFGLSNQRIRTLYVGTSIVDSGNLYLSSNATNSFLYGGASGLIVATGAATDGQLLIGRTGNTPVAATLTAGANITITNGGGTIQIASAAGGTINGGGTANYLTRWTGGTSIGNSSVIYDTNAGQIGIGTTSVGNVLHVVGVRPYRSQLSSSTPSWDFGSDPGNSNGDFVFRQYEASGGNANDFLRLTGTIIYVTPRIGSGFAYIDAANTTVDLPSKLVFRRAGGSGQAALSDVVNGYELGRVEFQAYTGGAYGALLAHMSSFVDGTFTAGQNPPTSIKFFTNIANSSASTVRLTISSDGGAIIGTATGGSQGAGTVNATGYYVNGVILPTPITGSGTTNIIPRFTSSTVLGNSIISDNNQTITVTSPTTTSAAFRTNSATGGNIAIYDTQVAATRGLVGFGTTTFGSGTSSDFGLLSVGRLLFASNGSSVALTIDNGVVVGSATGGDKGAGTVNATGLYINGVALTASGEITGSGTTNTIAKFTGSTAIGNSQIADDGTIVTLGGVLNVTNAGGHTIGGTANGRFGIEYGGTFNASAGGYQSYINVETRINGTAGVDVYGVRFAPTIGEASSGNHPLLAGLFVDYPAAASGAATVTNAASLYIHSAPAFTVSGKNYALWVSTDGGAALSRFDDNIVLASTKKLCFDGGNDCGDTYQLESSANVLDTYVGGTKLISATSTTINVTGTMAVSTQVLTDVLKTQTTDLTIDSSASGRSIFFKINGTEKMRVDSGGSIGIGGTPTLGTLDVFGSGVVGSTFRTTGAAGGVNVFYDTTNSATRGQIGYGSNLFSGAAIGDFGIDSVGKLVLGTGNGTVALTIDTSQNFTFGGVVTGPSDVFSIQRGVNPQELRVFGTTTTSKYAELSHDGTNSHINTSSGALAIDFAGTQKWSITSVGSISSSNTGFQYGFTDQVLLLQGTAGTATLQVLGSATSNNSFGMSINAGTTALDYALDIQASGGGGILDVFGNGNVQINNNLTNTAGYIFYVAAGTSGLNGRVYMKNITTSAGLQTAVLCQSSAGEVIADSIACLASSRRFKNDLGNMSTDYAFGLAMNMKPVKFSYKNEGWDKDRADWSEHFGFFAEDVAKLEPRLVNFEHDGITPRGVQYDMYTAVLTGAIQHMQKEIDDLKSQVKQLSAR